MSFINIVIKKSGINEDRDIVVDTILQTANVGLLEDTFEYELYESDNDTQVISVPISKTLNEKQQKVVARRIAHKLFDKGYADFDIEFGVNEAQLNEALLRRGSRGPEVKALQQQLGMPAAEQDGIFGPKTEQAVRNFQTNQGLQVDGIVGPQTQASIANAQAAGTATRDAPYNPQTVPQTPTQRRTQQQAPQTAAPQTSPRPRARPAQGSDEIQTRVLDKDGNAIEPMPVDDLANMANTAIDRANPDVNDPRAGNTDSGFRAPAPASGAGDSAAAQNTARLQNRRGFTPGQQVPPNAQSGAGDSAAAQNLAGPAQRGMAQADTGPAPGTGSLDAAQRSAEPYSSPTVNNQTTAAIGQQADQTIDTTAGADANVGQPGQQGGVDTLRQQRTDAQNKAADDRLIALAQQVKAANTAAEREKAVTALRGAVDAGVNTTDDPTTSSGDGFDVSRLKMAPKGPQVTTAAQANSIFQNPNATEEERKAAQMFYAKQGKQESVAPRPKGAFMFRERNEWDEKYGKTHNNDGSLRRRNFINESKMQEVTFHDDDEFFEAYGVLWFNEDEVVDEAEYKGRKVKLGKPMAGDVKKFKVYVRNPKGNVVKVNFGQKGAKIKKNNAARRRSFRARHNCDNPGPRHKARYWSCRKW